MSKDCDSDAERLPDEACFREMFWNAPLGCQSLDESGRILDVNATWVDILGYERDEVVGHSFAEFLDPDVADQFPERFSRFKEAGEVHSAIWQMIRADGTSRDISFEGRVLRDVDGKFLRTHCIINDVTELRQTEEALKESERRFQELVETISDWVFEVDAEGACTYSSPQVEVVLGYTSADVVGRAFFDLMSGDEADRVAEVFGALARRGEPIVAMENVALHKDGHRIVIETSAVPVIDADGRLCGYRGVNRDITARRHAEADSTRFHRVLERSLNEIYIFDAATLLFLEVNHGARENLGYSIEEFRTMTPLDFKPEFTAESFADLVEPLRSRTCEKIQFETVHERKDGTRYPVDVHLQLTDDEESVFIAIILDITEQKSAAKALEKVQEQYRATFEKAAVGVAHVSPTGRFLRANDTAASILGRTLEELDELTFQEITYPEDLDVGVQYIRDVVAGIREKATIEKRYVRPDGSLVWASVTASPIRDDEGDLQYFVFIIEDISERRVAEAELREREALLASIFRAASIGIGLVADRVLLRVNDHLCKMLGYTEDELVGQSSRILYPSQEEFEWVGQEKYRQIEEKGFGKVEVRMQAKDGSILDVLLSSTPLDLDDLSKGVTFTVLDITDRKRAEEEIRSHRDQLEIEVAERTTTLAHTNEELEEANQAKSEFLANMSHEFRTPLHSVIGFSDVMLSGTQGELNEEQHNQLEMIRASGKRLLTLVNDILDISKIEAGAVDVELTEMNINQCCAEAIEQVRPSAEDKGIELRFVPCEQECARRGLVMMDRDKLMQILLNLLGNAVKFTDVGSVELRVDCTGTEKVLVTVIDTGIGIKEDVLEDVFDEFEQVSVVDVAKPPGTGLGLPISRKLAHLLGGDITVKSTQGSGSEFTLELPLKFADDSSE